MRSIADFNFFANRQSAVPAGSIRRAYSKLSRHDMRLTSCFSPSTAHSPRFSVELPPVAPQTRARAELSLDFNNAQQGVFISGGNCNPGFVRSLQDVSDSRGHPATEGQRADGPTHSVYEMSLVGGTEAQCSAAIFKALMEQIVSPAIRELYRFGTEGPTGQDTATSAPSGEVRLDFSSLDSPSGELRLDIPEDPPAGYAELLQHLRHISDLLAASGLNAEDAVERIDTLYATQNPEFTWRTVLQTYARDVLPFALGAVLVTMIGGLIVTPPVIAAFRVLVESSVMIGVNVVWGAAYDAASKKPERRISPPIRGTERLATEARHLEQFGKNHAAGFAFGYCTRNFARLATELVLLGIVPHVLRNHRETIHVVLEVPLGLIAAAIVPREIGARSTPAKCAKLAMLLEQDCAETMLKSGETAKRPFFAGFSANVVAEIKSLVPLKITGILAVGLYGLSLLSPAQTSAREHYAATSGLYDRLTAIGRSLAYDDVWSQAILAIVYALIGYTVGGSKSGAIKREIESASFRRSAPTSPPSTSTASDSGCNLTISSHSQSSDGSPAPHLPSAGYHTGDDGTAVAFQSGSPVPAVLQQCAMTQRESRRMTPRNGDIPVTPARLADNDTETQTSRM